MMTTDLMRLLPETGAQPRYREDGTVDLVGGNRGFRRRYPNGVTLDGTVAAEFRRLYPPVLFFEGAAADTAQPLARGAYDLGPNVNGGGS